MREFQIEQGAVRMWHLFLVTDGQGYYVATFGSMDAALDYIFKEFT